MSETVHVYMFTAPVAASAKVADAVKRVLQELERGGLGVKVVLSEKFALAFPFPKDGPDKPLVRNGASLQDIFAGMSPVNLNVVKAALILSDEAKKGRDAIPSSVLAGKIGYESGSGHAMASCSQALKNRIKRLYPQAHMDDFVLVTNDGWKAGGMNGESLDQFLKAFTSATPDEIRAIVFPSVDEKAPETAAVEPAKPVVTSTTTPTNGDKTPQKKGWSYADDLPHTTEPDDQSKYDRMCAGFERDGSSIRDWDFRWCEVQQRIWPKYGTLGPVRRKEMESILRKYKW